MVATVAGIHLGIDTHANRPAGNSCPDGSMYSCSTHGLIYKSNFAGNSWATWATLGAAASGSITSSGYTQNTAKLLGRTTGSSGAIEEISVGSGLTLSAGSLSASGSAGAMTQITDTTLSGTATNVTFSTIAGSYSHLLILLQCRSDRVGQVFEGVDIQFNSDTGNNYDDVNPDISSAGLTPSGNIGHGAGWLASIPGATAAASAAGAYEVRINNYANAVFHKSWFTNGTVKYGTGATDIHTVLNSGQWRNTAAITDIKILTRNGSNFIVGSRFTLYGIT